MKNLEYYLSLPWTFKVRKVKDESGEYYLGYIQEIPSVRGHGDSLVNCYDLVMEILKSNLEIMLEDGDRIAEPVNKDYSGRFNVRIPKSLHKKLVEEAEEEGVSLNQLALYKLGL